MKKTALSLAISALALTASTAYGAAFQLTEQSALTLGRAYAGVGVAGDDASAPFFNAAGMTLLSGTQIQVTAVGVSMNQELKLTQTDRTFGGMKGYTNDGQNKTEVLPAFYLTHQINPEWWFGLSIASPFGLSTDYGDSSSGWMYGHRGYHAKLTDIDINPSIAWKPAEWLSIGAGASLQYAKAKLGMELPFGMANLMEDGDSWAFGWNVGIMIQPIETFRLGISYRSAVKHNAEGYLNVKTSNPLISPTGPIDAAFPSKVTIKTPDTVYLSALWEATPRLNLSASVRWAKWSNCKTWSLDQSGAIAAHPLLHSLPITHNYEDSWLIALGGDYKINDSWTVRLGVALEKDAVKDHQYRVATIPDGNRFFGSVGFTYNFNKNWAIDVAYLRVQGLGTSWFYNMDKETAQTVSALLRNEVKPQKVGKWHIQHSDIYGLNLRYKF